MAFNKIYKIFFQAISIFKKDKVILMLSLVPIGIGSLLYYFLGRWIMVDVLDRTKEWIQGFIPGDIGSIIYYILFFSFSIILIFLINWTFVLVVSIISSPFNDFISERVEKIKNESFDVESPFSLKDLLKDFFKTLFYEIKKVLFILTISLFVALIDLFIPFLAPIGIFLSSLLMSSQLLDYSWSRHQFSLKECLGGLKSEWPIYSISGLIFMVLFLYLFLI